MRSVLVISVSGIGNTILQLPLIKRLAAEPGLRVDVLLGTGAAATVVDQEPGIRRVWVLPGTSGAKFQLVRDLRAERYDDSVCCFPSNRLEFNVLPVVIGARRRVAHRYNLAQFRTLSFLATDTVPADPTLHDVEQNLALLRPFGLVQGDDPADISIRTEPSAERAATSYLEALNWSGVVPIGVHAGCKHSERYRRWPAQNFVSLIDRLNEEGERCLLFAGPDELQDVTQIYERLKCPQDNQLVQGLRLPEVSALIGQCRSFLSTDSGLGHIARAMGVPCLAIFGPAQPKRTGPYGAAGHTVSLQLECSPCMKYPFEATHSRIDCPYKYRCLTELSPDRVRSELASITPCR